jgi:hypothetical protein
MALKFTYTKFFGNFDDFVKCSEVSVNNNSWMNILIKERFNSREDFTSEDDD